MARFLPQQLPTQAHIFPIIKHGCRIGVLAARSVLSLSVLRVSRSAFCLAIKTVSREPRELATPIFRAKLSVPCHAGEHGSEDDYSRLI